MNTYYDKSQDGQYVKLIQEKGPFLAQPMEETQATVQAAQKPTEILMERKYFFTLGESDKRTQEAFAKLKVRDASDQNGPVGAHEESKTKNGGFNPTKLSFCDVLERIIGHFKQVMRGDAEYSYPVVLNRIYERQRLQMGASDAISMRDVYAKVDSFERLLQLIEEDIITMETSMSDA